MPAEIWKPVPGFEFRYEVSSLGRMRRVGTERGTFNGRAIKGGTGSRGDPKVDLWRAGKRHSFKIRDLIALVFRGARPPGKTARCIDGNPQNLTLGNIRYRTIRRRK